MSFAAPLDEIRRKLALVRRVEAEAGYGVLIEPAPVPLAPIDGVPDGLVEVFSIFRRIEGTCLGFAQPAEIGSPDAWRDRVVDDASPLGDTLQIGYGFWLTSKKFVTADRPVAHVISLNVSEGFVFFVDGDELAHLVKNGLDVEVEEFAPDIVTFVNDFVLGARYPELVAAVHGPSTVWHRLRQGRFTGQYTDTWLRLLVRAGLAQPVPESPPDGGIGSAVRFHH